jgi:hypothetical protein
MGRHRTGREHPNTKQLSAQSAEKQRYQGFRGEKGRYTYHKVPYDLFQQLQVSASNNASKTVQVNRQDLSAVSGLEWAEPNFNPSGKTYLLFQSNILFL